MIIKEDYKSKLEVIKAISVDRIKDPKHIPVDIYILEAYEIYEKFSPGTFFYPGRRKPRHSPSVFMYFEFKMI